MSSMQNTGSIWKKGRVSLLLWCVGVGLMLALAIPTWGQYTKLQILNDDWKNFSDVTARKEQKLAEIHSAMGYGGLIHSFKNYVLRGEQSYVESFHKNKQLVIDAIAEFKNFPDVTEEEVANLNVVQGTVQNYAKAFDNIAQMNGESIAGLDQKIRINDRPALRALSWLNQDHTNRWQQHTEELGARIADTRERVLMFFGFSLLSVLVLVLIGRSVVKFSIAEIQDKSKVLHFLQEETNEGWWDWSIADNEEYTSERFWRTFGRKQLNEDETPLHWMEILHPNDKEKLESAYQKHVKSFGEEPYSVEARFKHKDGHWVTISRRGRVIEWDKESRPLRMVGTHTDISELKNAQTELEENQDRRNTDSKLLTMGQIAGNIAHEINNPISIALVSSQMIKRNLTREKVNIEKAIQMSEHVEESLKRTSDIIKGLKSLSTDGKMDEWQCFKLKECISEMESLVHVKFRENRVSLKVDCEKELVLCARRVQVNQVLANLLNNAFDSVKELEEREIEIWARSSNNHIEIRVYDSGPGPSKEIQENMMLPFFTTKKAGQGTGMGLSLCKRIMETHYGNLEFDSKSSRSCFVLTFPKQEASKQVA